MKWCSLAVAALAALSLPAFDSDAWLAKRSRHHQTAEQLRADYRTVVSEVSDPAENLTLPIEVHSNGAVRVSVSALKAQMLVDRGQVWGEGVSLRELDEAERIVARLDARHALVDRQQRSVWLEDQFRAIYGQTELTGVGAAIFSEDEYVAIVSSAKVVTADFSLRRGETPGRLTIAADRADYDRGGGVLMLEGGVRLEDDGCRFAADRVFVFLEGTNALKRIVALGSVQVEDGDRRGRGDRAVYQHAQSKIDIYSAADGAAAELEQGGERPSRMAGDRITYWIDRQQVEVLHPHLVIGGKETHE